MERILIVYPHKLHALEGLEGREVNTFEKYPLAVEHLAASPPYNAVCCGIDERYTIPIFKKALALSPETRLIPIAKSLDEVVAFATKWLSNPETKDLKANLGEEWLKDPLAIVDILKLFPQGLDVRFSDLANKAANDDRPVLIEGEPGTGKKALKIAAQIHRLSQRSKAGGACQVLYCDQTGTSTDRLFGSLQPDTSEWLAPAVSPLELAEGGTLVVAGIEHLQRPAQLALLQLLDDPTMTFTRSGSRNRISADVRIMATANCLLRPLLDDTFEGELFYRLSLNYMRLPPLRDQPAEIERLAREFLTRLRAEPAKEKSAPPSSASSAPAELFSQPALRVLTRYPWPSNIRELKFAMHYAALRSTAEVDVAHLPPWIVNAAGRSEW